MAEDLNRHFSKEHLQMEFSGGSVLPFQGAQVPSLFGGLRSHMLNSVTKGEKKEYIQMANS